MPKLEVLKFKIHFVNKNSAIISELIKNTNYASRKFYTYIVTLNFSFRNAIQLKFVLPFIPLFLSPSHSITLSLTLTISLSRSFYHSLLSLPVILSLSFILSLSSRSLFSLILVFFFSPLYHSILSHSPSLPHSPSLCLSEYGTPWTNKLYLSMCGGGKERWQPCWIRNLRVTKVWQLCLITSIFLHSWDPSKNKHLFLNIWFIIYQLISTSWSI